MTKWNRFISNWVWF